jgi:hypothetical protein
MAPGDFSGSYFLGTRAAPAMFKILPDKVQNMTESREKGLQ